MEYKIKTALISVSDKTGICEFAEKLSKLGIIIYSTGGTSQVIKEHGIDVKSVSELTNFPEILDGRVKTLHPAIHGGLLAKLDKEEHIKQLKKYGLISIDLLVVNLYPFEKTLRKLGVTHEELIENIDIGGPAMVRASAKNYKHTAVVVNPNNYNKVIDEIQSIGDITISNRELFAMEAFSHTAYYDSLISRYFESYNGVGLMEEFAIPMRKSMTARYGENPHQEGALFGPFFEIFEKLHGKELSYNNILDIDSAGKLIIEFDEPTVAIVKHTNPCGVASDESLENAYRMAFATDTVSPFGGIIVVNRKLDLATAVALDEIFTELVIAPDFEEDALDLLIKKKNRRLIKANYNMLKSSLNYDFRSVAGGYLVQKTDTQLIDNNNIRVVTERQPDDKERKALEFAWKICKHVRSNAIVYCNENRTLGIGAGQMSRVDSARIAVEKAKIMGISLAGSVVASDAFFPFADGVEQAADAGARAIIQPGGSVRDDEVIAEANKRGMAMLFTGMRHFKH